MTAEPTLFVTAALVAALGTVVSALAFRGYRRHDSATMGLLAVGVFCVAVLPFPIGYGLAPLFALSDAATLLCILVAHIAGLVAMLASLDAV